MCTCCLAVIEPARRRRTGDGGAVVLAIVIGVAIGDRLDMDVRDTSVGVPVFFCFGVAAGILNVYRIMKRVLKLSPEGSTVPTDPVLRRFERTTAAVAAGATLIALAVRRGESRTWRWGALAGAALVAVSYWAIQGGISGLTLSALDRRARWRAVLLWSGATLYSAFLMMIARLPDAPDWPADWCGTVGGSGGSDRSRPRVVGLAALDRSRASGTVIRDMIRGRRIPPGCVARRSDMPNILTPRALPAAHATRSRDINRKLGRLVAAAVSWEPGTALRDSCHQSRFQDNVASPAFHVVPVWQKNSPLF